MPVMQIRLTYLPQLDDDRAAMEAAAERIKTARAQAEAELQRLRARIGQQGEEARK